MTGNENNGAGKPSPLPKKKKPGYPETNNPFNGEGSDDERQTAGTDPDTPPPSDEEAKEDAARLLETLSHTSDASSGAGNPLDVMPPAPFSSSVKYTDLSWTSPESDGSTGSPSVSIDDSQQPLISDNSSNNSTVGKKTNRSWKCAMQKPGFITPTVAATSITLCLGLYAAFAYLQNKAMLTALIASNIHLITTLGIIAASLFAIGMICAITQYINTKVYEINAKDPDNALNQILEWHKKESKIIKDVTMEHSNGTIVRAQCNIWNFNQNGCANVDEEVVRKTSKAKSLINDRPLFTALSTVLITTNIMLPLMLYAVGGINNVQIFYGSILATKVGLSLLVASSVLTLSVLYLGMHYYNKTSCANIVCDKHSDMSNEKVNQNLSSEVKEKRIEMLKESHDQTGKCESLGLFQVGITRHNSKKEVYNIVSCAA